jgi:hypothetical protein
VALKILAQGFARIAGILLGKRKGKVLLVSWTRMATRLRFGDKLDWSTNISPWKGWIVLLLEENENQEIVEKTQVVTTNTTFITAYNKKNVKTKRILFDAMKDHIIPRVRKEKCL